METIIQFIVEHADLLLALLIGLLSVIIMFLRARLKAVGNEVVIGLQILRDAASEESPGGKKITPEETRLLAAQSKRIIEEAVRHFGGPRLKKLFGVKEPESKQIYYNS